MGPKKPQKASLGDPDVDKQFREEEIARVIYQTEEQTQLPRAKKMIVDTDDENAMLASMINNEMLVQPENVRDPGSQLYRRILYTWGMTPKFANLLRRLRCFTEEQIDDHINWFNDTFDANATRVAEIKYTKTTFGPRMSGLHQHKKLLDAKTMPANENKYIQEWVDEDIDYPYTPIDMGNRKYKQTVAQTGFTEDVLKALVQRGFTPSMIDKHIRTVRTIFGFHIGAAKSRRIKHTPPKVLPDHIFIEIPRKTPTTTSNATPAKPSQSVSTSATGSGTETTTMEKTIGTMVLMAQGTSSEEQELPIISEDYSMSTVEDIEEPGAPETLEIEYISTAPKETYFFDPKDQLSSIDLRIKRELIDDDVQPGDPDFYPRLQHVYRNLQKVEKIAEATRQTKHHPRILMTFNSINQILFSLCSKNWKNSTRGLGHSWFTRIDTLERSVNC